MSHCMLDSTASRSVYPMTKAFGKTAESAKTGEKARLVLPDGREIFLDVMRPTMGDEFICDIRNLYNESKVLMFDPGFNSVAACASAVTYTDGDHGVCMYRGYTVPKLLARHDYLTVAYLLLYGDLPNVSQRADFESRIKKEMLVHTRLKEFIQTFVPGAHPMSILASVLSAMASFYADPMHPEHMTDKESRDLACIRLIAKIPTVVAMAYKVLIGEPMVYPRSDLTFSENLLHMMFASPCCPYDVDPLHAEIIDTFLSIHADHEQNASTSTVRTAGSSLANPYACIATGVTSLWGRAHGGANEAVVDMLTRIGRPEQVPKFVERVKAREVRLMGFGHRVYRNYDPRARIMQSLCWRLFEQKKVLDPLFEVAKALETTALNDVYFTSRKLYPNVDFYSGIVMRALGIPKEMFTVFFAMGRAVGWLSHWREMVESHQVKITRPRQLYLGPTARSLEPEPQDAPPKVSSSSAISSSRNKSPPSPVTADKSEDSLTAGSDIEFTR